ncbi:MAG: sulfur carrier protein ThiS [Planctomycetota bacterium]|jgi:thiamine biosynthesis protein ThiS|nr:sulfur carrier protein ThiS [Planctomycetota bacterium]MDG1983614.1 sulfur carrier protein ThiS [Planctomycetota bacterium]
MDAASTRTIHVNGEPLEVSAGSTVADLVAARGLRPEQVAVEVNQELAPRATHPERALEAGDRVEIVTLVGGG